MILAMKYHGCKDDVMILAMKYHGGNDDVMIVAMKYHVGNDDVMIIVTHRHHAYYCMAHNVPHLFRTTALSQYPKRLSC